MPGRPGGQGTVKPPDAQRILHRYGCGGAEGKEGTDAQRAGVGAAVPLAEQPRRARDFA